MKLVIIVLGIFLVLGKSKLNEVDFYIKSKIEQHYLIWNSREMSFIIFTDFLAFISFLQQLMQKIQNHFRVKKKLILNLSLKTQINLEYGE